MHHSKRNIIIRPRNLSPQPYLKYWASKYLYTQISERQPSGLTLTNGSAGGHEENDEKYGQQEKYSSHQPSPLLKFSTPILPANILERNSVLAIILSLKHYMLPIRMQRVQQRPGFHGVSRVPDHLRVQHKSVDFSIRPALT